MPQIPDGSRDVVRRMLVDMQECLRIKVQYRGKRHFGSGGHNKLIEMDSVEVQITPNNLESGISVKHTTAPMNEHHGKCNPTKIHVGMSAVSSAVLRPSLLHPN